MGSSGGQQVIKVLLLLYFSYRFVIGLGRDNPSTLHIVAEVVLALVCISLIYRLVRDYRRPNA